MVMLTERVGLMKPGDLAGQNCEKLDAPLAQNKLGRGQRKIGRLAIVILSVPPLTRD